MPDIEIKRGYEVLPDNNIRFGIRVINNSDYTISDVEIILDYNESLFGLEGNKIQKLGNIPPTVPRTAKFILKPLGCIHKEEISATVLYKDHQWKKHTEEMRSKEVHCVCPFLKEKSITRADFLRLSNFGYMEERGVNFEGIDVDKLVSFISHTCKNRLYKVDQFPIENGIILYLAGDALGEKAYYLLTAVVKEYSGLTQVLLRAASDKQYGLNGFLNEILDNLRHLVQSTSAREIGIIKKDQVINIINSIVQRTTFATGEGTATINIKDSVVKRTTIKGDEERKRKEKERLRKEKERQKARDEEDRLRKQREEQERVVRELKPPERKGTSWEVSLATALVVGILLLGYWTLAPGASNVPEPSKLTLTSTSRDTPGATTTPKITPTVSPATMATTTGKKITTAQAAQAGNWPMFMHDLEHTSTSDEIIPLPLHILWKYPTGNYVYSSPAVSGGVVYIGSNDFNVYALDASTGSLKWKYTTGDSVGSSPAVSGGVVYIGSGDGNVYALDASTGSLKWKYATGNIVSSSPAVSGEFIYIGSYNGNVYALDASTGSLKWKYTTGAVIHSSPAVSGGVVYIASDDGAATDNGNVYALDASTGSLKWKYTTGGEIWSSPGVSGEFIYIGSYNGNVYALDASTGSLKWKYTTGAVIHSSPAVSGGVVYIGSGDSNVYALDALTGSLKWKYTMGEGGVISSPAVSGNIVYVGSGELIGNVYALDTSTGSLKWKYATGSSIGSSPAVSGGVVYIGSWDGNVYAFAPDSLPLSTIVP